MREGHDNEGAWRVHRPDGGPQDPSAGGDRHTPRAAPNAYDRARR